jgi:hypothetical protein
MTSSILFSRVRESHDQYVWPIYPTYEIFSANIDASGVKRLTKSSGYDAEGTISPDGKKIVFTSMRSGDLDMTWFRALPLVVTSAAFLSRVQLVARPACLDTGGKWLGNSSA